MALERGTPVLEKTAETMGSEVDRLPERMGMQRESDCLPDRLGTMRESDSLPDKLGTPHEANIPPDVPEARQRDASRHSDNSRLSGLGKKELRETEELQSIADNAAMEYNNKYQPYERAQKKGLTDVEKTKNGGVPFENSSAIYTDKQGNKGVVRIPATGSRTKDFDAANKAMGLTATPEGYVWHHKDDYDVKTNAFTMELVKDEAHNSTKPHSGGCAQYDAVHGPTYNK